MDSEKKQGFQLNWPWNWAVCSVFIVVAGHFIGYLWSALLAALFLWWQKKRHPGTVPQGATAWTGPGGPVLMEGY